MISTESFEPFRGMESLLMAQRATNQNPFVVLLPPQFVVSLEGGKKDIYNISIFYPVRYFLNVFLEELANL